MVERKRLAPEAIQPPAKITKPEAAPVPTRRSLVVKGGFDLTEGTLVSLYLRDSKVGSGYQILLVIDIGKHETDLLDIPTTTKITVPNDYLVAQAEPFPKAAKAILANLKATVRQREELGLSVATVAVRTALELLRAF